ncbi:DUF262 domain-containing protein [Nannocystis sp. ncelm1]|uniref:DUF262 domain-containing protein n=1 Tax=Nannocystis radixulma TaxID=2995305 RepID=A0ABT5BL74_9BACT|nr:DUF262 domain-containing protein [Nannocystis radixulma]
MPALRQDKIKVEEAIRRFRTGDWAIPEFQRAYVWKPGRAAKLIDSLYKQYPISSLLIWKTDGEVQRRDQAGGRDRASWLIDGQQRVTTLAHVLEGAEGLDIVFHVTREEFQQASASTRNDGQWVRVSDLWDSSRFREIRRSLPSKDRDKVEDHIEKVRQILNYEVPYTEMEDYPFQDAVDAFQRVNTQGIRLRAQDLESAHVASKHTGFIRNEVVPLLKKLHEAGFERIHVTHLFRACGFLAHPDGRRKTPLHELGNKDVQRAWKRTQDGMERVRDLLGGEFGLLDTRLLSSGAALVPAIVLCADNRPSKQSAQAIAGWMALASLHHRYSVSTETSLEQDLRACRAENPIGALLTQLRQRRDSLAARSLDFKGYINDRGALFAAYVACAHRQVRDLLTGGKIHLHKRIDRHHIFPRAGFEAGERKEADTIANIAFIGGDANRELSDQRPENYLGKIAKKVLESQCLPTEPSLWGADSVDQFWARRRELLAEAFNAFLAEALPGRHLT